MPAQLNNRLCWHVAQFCNPGGIKAPHANPSMIACRGRSSDPAVITAPVWHAGFCLRAADTERNQPLP